MKSKYWVALLFCLLAVCAGLGLWLMQPQENAAQAVIASGGVEVVTVDLSKDQELTVQAPNGGSNTITIKDGKIAVTAASCPDHYCMDRGFCSGGVQIVCLPNKLVIEFVGEQEVDGAVG